MQNEWNLNMIYQGQPRGGAVVRRDGLYYEILCDCDMVSQEVERASLRCGEERLPLGVLMPEQDRLRLKKRWPVSATPAGDFQNVIVGQELPEWRSWQGEFRGVEITGAMRKEEDGVAHIAVPFSEEEPFPYTQWLLGCRPVVIGDAQYLELPPEDWEEPLTEAWTEELPQETGTEQPLEEAWAEPSQQAAWTEEPPPQMENVTPGMEPMPEN